MFIFPVSPHTKTLSPSCSHEPRQVILPLTTSSLPLTLSHSFILSLSFPTCTSPIRPPSLPLLLPAAAQLIHPHPPSIDRSSVLPQPARLLSFATSVGGLASWSNTCSPIATLDDVAAIHCCREPHSFSVTIACQIGTRQQIERGPKHSRISIATSLTNLSLAQRHPT